MLCTKLIGLYYVCFIIFGMGYSLTIILLTKIVCKDSSRKGIMNGIISVGTALGASLYNIIISLVNLFLLILKEKRQQLRANFMNLKSQIILKNILF